MSSIVGTAAGITANALGVYQALTGAPQLFQFLDGYGNTIVIFDATLSESYDTSTTPTEFPVEDGSTICDHIVRKPFTLSISAIISDTPITGVKFQATEAATVAATLALPPLGVVAAASAYALVQAHQKAQSPSLSAYNAIYTLQNGDPGANPPIAPQPFTCVSKLGTFDNMVITDLSVPRDADSGSGALRFDVKLQQVTVVYSQSIDVTGTNSQGMAALKKSAGELQTEEEESALHIGYVAGQNLVTSVVE